MIQGTPHWSSRYPLWKLNNPWFVYYIIRETLLLSILRACRMKSWSTRRALCASLRSVTEPARHKKTRNKGSEAQIMWTTNKRGKTDAVQEPYSSLCPHATLDGHPLAWAKRHVKVSEHRGKTKTIYIASGTYLYLWLPAFLREQQQKYEPVHSRMEWPSNITHERFAVEMLLSEHAEKKRF